MSRMLSIVPQALAAAVAVGLLATPAQAAIFSTVLGEGISKDNPDTDGTSIFGASLAGSVISFDTLSGIFSAEIVNAGEGVVTGVAFDLNNAIFGANTGVFTADLTLCPGCAFGGGAADPNVEDGFGDFDIGAAALPPPSTNGIETSEVALFEWDFSGLGLDFSSILAFTDVIDTHPVNLDAGHPLDSLQAFWVAQVQVLGENGSASDHIGGQFGSTGGGDEVPEPTALALFGFGLLGLGWAARRRRHAA